MPIPKFHEFFRPFLVHLSREGPLHMDAVQAKLQAATGLQPEDLARRLPSGVHTVIENRIGWARTFLYKAELIERVAKATYQISDAGKKVLADCPERISLNELRQVAAFQKWVEGCKSRREGLGELPKGVPVASGDSSASDMLDGPMDEIMADCELRLRQLVEESLRKRISELTPARFEYLVEQLVVGLGYGSSDDEVRRALGGGHGDGGVDGVINEDRLGLGQIYLQAKRWESTVGRPELQKFVGAMHGRAQKGVFITSGEFSRDAEDYAKHLQGLKLRLIDGAELVRLMVDCGMGVSEARRYTQFRIDNDFFEEGE